MSNSNNGKKSQASLLILLGVVTVVMIGWIIGTFLASRYQERVTEKIKLSKLSKYLDNVKGFSRGSLIFASHAALEKVAALGGEYNDDGEARNWICNLNTFDPTVDEVRYFLSEETEKRLNSYLVNLNVEELVKLSITNYTCIDYDVNEISVSQGLSDERFNVGAYGSKINVSYEKDIVSSDNDVYEEIAQVRFWYMYRKFREWAPGAASTLTNGVCNCLAYACCPLGFCDKTCPQFQSCVEEVINQALNQLKAKFKDDPYVECSATLGCCYAGIISCCPSPSGCFPWLAPECLKCLQTPAEPPCAKQLISLAGSSSFSLESEEDVIRLAGDCIPTYHQVGGSIESGFSCKDNKYLLSTKGDRHLVFSVDANIFLQRCQCCRYEECCEEINDETICKTICKC